MAESEPEDPTCRTRRHNYWRLWNFALEGITGFTVMPLKIATCFGLVTLVLAGAYAT